MDVGAYGRCSFEDEVGKGDLTFQESVWRASCPRMEDSYRIRFFVYITGWLNEGPIETCGKGDVAVQSGGSSDGAEGNGCGRAALLSVEVGCVSGLLRMMIRIGFDGQ